MKKTSRRVPPKSESGHPIAREKSAPSTTPEKPRSARPINDDPEAQKLAEAYAKKYGRGTDIGDELLRLLNKNGTAAQTVIEAMAGHAYASRQHVRKPTRLKDTEWQKFLKRKIKRLKADLSWLSESKGAIESKAARNVRLSMSRDGLGQDIADRLIASITRAASTDHTEYSAALAQNQLLRMFSHRSKDPLPAEQATHRRQSQPWRERYIRLVRRYEWRINLLRYGQVRGRPIDDNLLRLVASCLAALVQSGIRPDRKERGPTLSLIHLVLAEVRGSDDAPNEPRKILEENFRHLFPLRRRRTKRALP